MAVTVGFEPKDPVPRCDPLDRFPLISRGFSHPLRSTRTRSFQLRCCHSVARPHGDPANIATGHTRRLTTFATTLILQIVDEKLVLRS